MDISESLRGEISSAFRFVPFLRQQAAFGWKKKTLCLSPFLARSLAMRLIFAF
jgi:hypothetical protein